MVVLCQNPILVARDRQSRSSFVRVGLPRKATIFPFRRPQTVSGTTSDSPRIHGYLEG